MARLLVGVGGSIAAFKACALVSQLVQDGHEVDVAMTRAACRFVRPLSFAALTHRTPFTDRRWFSPEAGPGGAADHLRATESADLLVVAPATADLLARMAHGLADDVVCAAVLGATCPVLVAPAMNARMWAHPRVVANVERLRADGVAFVGPVEGRLAEGGRGPGRMSEPEEIRTAIARCLP